MKYETTTLLNAPIKIKPSNAIFTIPERSHIVPPIAVRAKGVAILIIPAKSAGVKIPLSCSNPC
ncbi:unnamed protein product [marine sediment metagenome]|uniref:Uncharacterized protein n=1 Tax=marine sediment metagenome TaxID=412755 RepID=X1M4A3_9ZZZZ